MQDKVQQLQLIEQNIQQLLVQKQSLQSQLIELESAVEELGSSEEAWRIVGNVMVKTDPKKLKESLSEKKKVLDLRIKTVEKQEEKLRAKAQELQQSVVEKMKDGSKSD